MPSGWGVGSSRCRSRSSRKKQLIVMRRKRFRTKKTSDLTFPSASKRSTVMKNKTKLTTTATNNATFLSQASNCNHRSNSGSSSSSSNSVIDEKMKKLQSIIPGAGEDSQRPEKLLLRTADYILLLNSQLHLLKSLSKVYGFSYHDYDDGNDQRSSNTT